MKRYTFLVCLILLLAVACRKEQKFSGFTTNILTPLAHGRLDIGDLLKDSGIYTNPLGEVSLVYEYDLYNGRLADYFDIPDTQRKTTLNLQSLKLADQTTQQVVTLVSIFPAAVFLNGQTVTIPAQSVTNTPPIPIDGSGFFKTATFNSGTMEITIDNGFPIELEVMVFELRNTNSNTVVAVDTFKNILPYTSQSKVINLAGKTVDAQMTANVRLLQTKATPNPVLVNINDAATISIAVKDLKPKSAIAKFPAQSVISKDEVVVYDFGGAAVKRLDIKSGDLKFTIISTIQEEMTVKYKIPYAFKNGSMFEESFVVAAAPPGGSTVVDKIYPLDGYDLDLRGRNPLVNDTVNSFYNILDVTIDSTGHETNISLEDSIYIFYGLFDLIPSYAEGYFGQQTVNVGPETFEFSQFANTGGSIDLEDVNVTLDIINGVGANAIVDIKNITARNGKGSAIQLNSPAISAPIPIAAATYPPYTPSRFTETFTRTNSNIKAFIESLPDKLDYTVDIKTNPGGNNGLYKDFITDQSSLVARLGINIPLSFKASNLALQDTLHMNFGNMQYTDRILEGALNVIVENGFPLDALLQLYILDQNGAVTDSLTMSGNNIISGAVDPTTKKVTTPKRSVATARANMAQMDKLRHDGRILVKATFNTDASNPGYTKIYNNYIFDIKLTGDFIYDKK